jgi:small multidrug resistance pump
VRRRLFRRQHSDGAFRFQHNQYGGIPRPSREHGGQQENTMLPMGYVYLGIAIVAEVIGTSTLKASDGFTRFLPSFVTIVTYACAFYFLSLTLRTIPVGIAYAIWSGIGTVLIALIGLFWFRQPLDLAAVIGLGLIIAGVAVVNAFSRSIAH